MSNEEKRSQQSRSAIDSANGAATVGVLHRCGRRAELLPGGRADSRRRGVELFDRTKHQIALTPAGEVFLDHAREVKLAVRRAQSSTEEYRGQLMRTVALGALT